MKNIHFLVLIIARFAYTAFIVLAGCDSPNESWNLVDGELFSYRIRYDTAISPSKGRMYHKLDSASLDDAALIVQLKKENGTNFQYGLMMPDSLTPYIHAIQAQIGDERRSYVWDWFLDEERIEKHQQFLENNTGMMIRIPYSRLLDSTAISFSIHKYRLIESDSVLYWRVPIVFEIAKASHQIRVTVTPYDSVGRKLAKKYCPPCTK